MGLPRFRVIQFVWLTYIQMKTENGHSLETELSVAIAADETLQLELHAFYSDGKTVLCSC